MKERISYLLDRRLQQQLTPPEAEELLDILNRPEWESLVTDNLRDLAAKEPQGPALDPQWVANNIRQIFAIDKVPQATIREIAPESSNGNGRVRMAWFRYAAALIIILGAAGYIWFRKSGRQTSQEITYQQDANSIQAARTGAVLTLGDGSTLELDTMGNRMVAAQNGTKVLLKNGQLLYDPSGSPAGGIVYNAITTAKGKQFNIVLPDGTKVHLNAASSLRYPTTFTGSERRVEVTGEAYFEVAKKADLPFRVSINQQMDVEVLGTSFNVNAYKDENNVQATLVEGSIRVVKGEDRTLLKPGEQARISESIRVIKNADVEKALAWKNGIFNFEGVGLREMMRQLERWYDIEVVYGENVPDVKFFGKISRRVDLATVLEALKGFGLHYDMKPDRKLTVFL